MNNIKNEDLLRLQTAGLITYVVLAEIFVNVMPQ
ncbi:hypothetical protein Slin_5268 [Spirosoma linguale DSM 74]|uniref:Uncharacterized protein n=1 Tax=Spirosoma linguale (strain ATCC 33905 / DSM 74 / LMG 10896 / Claus 1) TaxID=504472 RepID=D2QE23_SPILD|nr:hypothetical protein Slin_5268 [Spirosoma linguale DSM 74]